MAKLHYMYHEDMLVHSDAVCGTNTCQVHNVVCYFCKLLKCSLL